MPKYKDYHGTMVWVGRVSKLIPIIQFFKNIISVESKGDHQGAKNN